MAIAPVQQLQLDIAKIQQLQWRLQKSPKTRSNAIRKASTCVYLRLLAS
jgi:hypothetical protein